MAERALMALFDAGHRIDLPNGYYLQKRDDDAWHIGGLLGGTACLLGLHITSNAGIGQGGSIDEEIKTFADAINGDGTADT